MSPLFLQRETILNHKMQLRTGLSYRQTERLRCSLLAN
nr:MAG TPA: hypothetical protein [Caudoviricetes sp.]